jgi:acyl dehydratase
MTSTTESVLDILSAQVGSEYYSSDWFEIDRAHLEMFAWSTYLDEAQVDLTTSHNNPLGADLVDGFMLLSLLLHFKFKYAPRYSDTQWGFNYGLNTVRFTSPVTLGQRIRARATLADARPRGEGIMVTTDDVIDVEGQAKPAMVAQWLSLWYEGARQ